MALVLVTDPRPRSRGPVAPGKGTVHWTLTWDILPGWVSHCTPLGGGPTVQTLGEPVTLTQSGSWKHPTHGPGHTAERGEEAGTWSGLLPAPAPLLAPEGATCPCHL